MSLVGKGIVRVALVVGLIGVAVAGCSGTDVDTGGGPTSTWELTWSDEPPFRPAASYLVDASLGDMWVVQNRTGTELPDAPAFAARRGDGKWAALPNPPEPYESVALASVAGEVVLGGVVCDDPSECVSGHTEWSTLADDLTSWNVLDADLAFDNDREAVITSMPGRHDVGVFSTPSGRVVIDAEHSVRPIPSNTGGAMGDGAACIIGTTLFETFAAYTNLEGSDISGAIGYAQPTMSTLDLSDPTAEWTAAPPPPDGTVGLEAACLTNGVLFVDNGVESVLDLTTTTWATRTDPAGALLAGRNLEPGGASSALTGDGTLYLLTGLGFPVLRRSTDGTWSDTGVNATSVASTEAIALALNIDQPDVTEIPPT